VEQVHCLSVAIIRIGDAGEIQEDERKLERSPRRVLNLKALLEGTSHRSIGDPERVEGIGVIRENFDATLDSIRGDYGQPQKFLCSRRVMFVQLLCVAVSGFDPCPVLDDQMVEGAMDLGPVLKQTERSH